MCTDTHTSTHTSPQSRLNRFPASYCICWKMVASWSEPPGLTSQIPSLLFLSSSLNLLLLLSTWLLFLPKRHYLASIFIFVYTDDHLFINPSVFALTRPSFTQSPLSSSMCLVIPCVTPEEQSKHRFQSQGQLGLQQKQSETRHKHSSLWPNACQPPIFWPFAVLFVSQIIMNQFLHSHYERVLVLWW